MAEDEVSNALLRHSVDDLRKAVEKLSGTVSDYNVLQHRVTLIETDLKEMKSRKIADRRMLLVALVFPTSLWLFQLFVTSRGGV